MNPVIEIKNLSKSYLNGKERKEVLKGINLQIEPGRVIGYIGPNGAGKSTTVKIMCGLLEDFEGEVKVGGLSIKEHSSEIKQSIGYIPENASLYESITPMEYFSFIADMRKLSTDAIREKAGGLMRLFELEENAHQRIGSFSKGMKQKVLIISALLHDPDIIFMDEPLSGLDANSVIRVKELITNMAAEGKTIFYSSHLMDVVEKVSHRIILINKGIIVADGSFEALRGEHHDESLEKLFARITSRENSANSLANS